MRRRGITLVEVLLAATIAALVMIAAGNAYVVGTRTAATLSNGRDTIAKRAEFQAQLTDLFNHVYLDPDVTDFNSYFLSGDNLASKAGGITSTTASAATTTTTAATAAAPASPTSGSGSNGSGTGDNGTLVFVTAGRRLPTALLSSTDDFETNNQNFGPVAGLAEVQISTAAVGSPSGGQQGLFMRTQAPADNDPTQGGNESLLDPDIETIKFEFWDGTTWETTWDTTTMTTPRLPAAVRVTYKYRDETNDRILVLQIPASDVTTDNPVTETSTS